MKEIDDPYIAGKLADGLGHYARVMIVRILRSSGSMALRDLQKEIRNEFNRDIPYSTLQAHAKKLVFSGICEEVKVNNMNGLKLVRDVEVVLWDE